MADVVIVVGTKRGNEEVPVIDVKQMCGRAGRKHGGDDCYAHVICEDGRLDEIRSGMEEGKNMEVHSSLSDPDSIIFHLLPEIVSGNVVNVVTAEKWYARSLGSYQGGDIDFLKVFDRMEKVGAITVGFPDGVRPTKIGEIASDLYFHPADMQAWKLNFDKLFDLGLENDNAAIAWALGTLPHTRRHGDFGTHRFVLGEYKSALPLGLEIEEGTMIQGVLWWCAMGCASAGRMRNQIFELRDDIGRIKRGLIRLDREIAGWKREDFFSDVELMVRKSISVNLVDLCKLPGITKGRAAFLYERGARDVSGIADVIPGIEDEIDEPFLNALKGIVNGVC